MKPTTKTLIVVGLLLWWFWPVEAEAVTETESGTAGTGAVTDYQIHSSGIQAAAAEYICRP